MFFHALERIKKCRSYNGSGFVRAEPGGHKWDDPEACLVHGCELQMHSRWLADTAVARQHALGLTLRQIIDKFKTEKMVDVVLLTTDGRTIILPRRIDPNPDTALLIFPPLG